MMRQFNLKGECWLVPNSHNDDPSPGRTITSEGLRMTEPGWVQRNCQQSEFVQRRECDIEEDELRAAREWLAHVEAGRIGPNR